MSLPAPSSGGPALRLRVLGFPVRIGPSFLIVLALLGWTGSYQVSELVVWIVLGAVSILLHELGHAVAARTTGAEPTIDLYGFGGVTQYVPPRQLSRARAVSISLAGPLVGVAIGAALYLGVPHDSLVTGSIEEYAWRAAFFVNFWWGVLNLLPVLPLDGGQTLMELLPGDPDTRRRRAAVVSVAVAGAAAVYALQRGYVFGGVLGAWFAMSNLAAARGPQATTVPPPPAAPSDIDRGALYLVDNGKIDEARHLVATAPPGTPPDLAVEGLVTALTGRPHVGGEMVVRAYHQAPGNPLRVGCLARLLTFSRDWAGLRRLLESPPGALVPVDLVAWAQHAAFTSGAYAESAALAAPVLDRAGAHGGRIAYNEACGWSRAGEPERALAALERAAALGWRDVAAAETDDDLAAARALAGWPAVRARLAEASTGHPQLP